MHKLSLNIPKASDCSLLSIYDASYYDVNFPISNTILEIKPPGSCCFIPFDLDQGWCSKTLNCLDLSLCCDGNTCSLLPDGNYEIKYSIDPNEFSMVEFNYFRVCQLWSNYTSEVCKYQDIKCNLSKSEKEEFKNRLYNIRNMINDSVILSEECLNVAAAYELYNEAKNLLTNGTGCQNCM